MKFYLEPTVYLFFNLSMTFILLVCTNIFGFFVTHNDIFREYLHICTKNSQIKKEN